MQMLEIAARENGAHSNQTYHGFLPDGWAVIPDDMTLEAFPFGTVEATVDEETGLMTVTKWTPGTLPEPDPGPEPGPTVEDLVAENKLLKAQVQAQTERSDFLEDCIAEMAAQVYGE